MAEQLSADVVVVGAGVAGGFVAYELAKKGLSVLILEAGPAIDRNDAVATFLASPTKGPNSPYPETAYAPQPDDTDWDGYYVQQGPDRFQGLYLRAVGGTTWHWGGFVQRLRPNDLRLQSLYKVGVDWPLSYDDLEPWYDLAEREIGVSGSDTVPFGGPRKTGYPMPPVPATYLDAVVAKAVAPLGLTAGVFPQARNSTFDFNDRPQCCGNATCVPICPIQAKYDATDHVDKATGKKPATGAAAPLATPAKLVEEAVVHTLVAGADGKIAQVLYKRSDGTEGAAAGRVVVLAANAVETAKLMLMSRTDARPQGIGNGSGLVGRNLMSQIDMSSRGLTKEPIYPYRGPVMTSGFLEFRDGDFRSAHAAVGTSLSNAGWTRARGPLVVALAQAASGVHGAALDQAVADHAARELVLGSTAETLPDPDNRVEPAYDKPDSFGLPRPRIHYAIDRYALDALDLARQRHIRILEALGATEVEHDAPGTSTAILLGTARMGTDPRQSVVNPDLRSHDHPNLFVVGGAVFPTATCSQPTLTIAALALRAAQRIAQDLA